MALIKDAQAGLGDRVHRGRVSRPRGGAELSGRALPRRPGAAAPAAVRARLRFRGPARRRPGAGPVCRGAAALAARGALPGPSRPGTVRVRAGEPAGARGLGGDGAHLAHLGARPGGRRAALRERGPLRGGALQGAAARRPALRPRRRAQRRGDGRARLVRVFGAAHVALEGRLDVLALVQMLLKTAQTTCIALVLGAVYVRTRSFLGVVALHALADFFPLALVAVLGGLEGSIGSYVSGGEGALAVLQGLSLVMGLPRAGGTLRSGRGVCVGAARDGAAAGVRAVRAGLGPAPR